MSNTPRETIAYLGLGSNLGDRMESLRAALHALDRHDAIQVDWNGGIAPVYETSPVGGSPDQPMYLNTALRITTTLDPYALLQVVLSIENDMGRVRDERWSARKIDIDILLYGQLTLDDDRLTVPHSRLHERLFVLAPLCDIAGDVMHPHLNVSIRQLARSSNENRLGDRVILTGEPLAVQPGASNTST